MEIVEREIRVGECIIRLDENDIFVITISGIIDEDVALEITEEMEAFERRFGRRKRNIFIDNNKSGKITSKARKIFHELDSRETTGKVAVFGLHPVARVLASFYMGTSENKNMRFFNNKDEALDWLKE